MNKCSSSTYLVSSHYHFQMGVLGIFIITALNLALQSQVFRKMQTKSCICRFLRSGSLSREGFGLGVRMQEKCRVQSWDHLPEQLCVWQLGGQEHLWTDLARMILRVSLSLPGETRCKLNVEEEAVMRVSLQKRPHILPLLSVHSWAVTWEHCLLPCTPSLSREMGSWKEETTQWQESVYKSWCHCVIPIPPY